MKRRFTFLPYGIRWLLLYNTKVTGKKTSLTPAARIFQRVSEPGRSQYYEGRDLSFVTFIRPSLEYASAINFSLYTVMTASDVT
jgi:hypothetical protein